MHEFIIRSFDPLIVEIPKVKEVEGEILITLPPLHLVLMDLSFDGMIPAHIGADANIASLKIFFSKPVETGKVIDFIVAAMADLIKTHQLAQEELSKKPLL